jgi:hypothetical protein
MTLVGCGIQPNLTLNFGPNTRLIMDISLIHVYDYNHKFKTSSIRDAEQRKRCKYADFYQRQGFSFVPMICNTLGECGPDMLHFLWNLADRSARHHYGFHPIEHGLDRIQCQNPLIMIGISGDCEENCSTITGSDFKQQYLKQSPCAYMDVRLR